MTGNHTVYASKREAEEAGIQPVYWKEAQVGDWALSDDDFAAEVFQREVYGGRQDRPFLVTPVCRVWVNQKSKLLIVRYLMTKKFSATNPEVDWNERESRQLRTKRAVRVYVAMLVSDQEIDWRKVGVAYRPDQADPEASARRLILRNDDVQKLVQKEAELAMSPLGITPEAVVEGIVSAIDLAKEQRKPAAMLRGNIQLGKMLGMW